MICSKCEVRCDERLPREQCDLRKLQRKYSRGHPPTTTRAEQIVSRPCDVCGGELVFDTIELVCSRCGLVYDDLAIDKPEETVSRPKPRIPPKEEEPEEGAPEGDEDEPIYETSPDELDREAAIIEAMANRPKDMIAVFDDDEDESTSLDDEDEPEEDKEEDKAKPRTSARPVEEFIVLEGGDEVFVIVEGDPEAMWHTDDPYSGTISFETDFIRACEGQEARPWSSHEPFRLSPDTGRVMEFRTHYDFVRAPFWVGCSRPDEFTRECNDSKSCKRCQYRLDLSFRERERGWLKGEDKNDISKMNRNFSWPYQCMKTFQWLPHPPFDDHLYDSDEELATYFAEINEKHSDDCMWEPLPKAPATIKKYRPPGAEWHRTFGISRNVPPYPHIAYDGTSIGDLLEKHLHPGRGALEYLFCYYIGFHLGNPCDEPTRSNLIKFFVNLSGIKESLARDRYDELIKCKVVWGVERTGRQENLLCLRDPEQMNGLLHWHDLPPTPKKPSYPATKAFFSPVKSCPKILLAVLEPEFKVLKVGQPKTPCYFEGYDFAGALEVRQSKTTWYIEYYKSKRS